MGKHEQAVVRLRALRDSYMVRARIYAHLIGDEDLAGLALDKAYTFHRQAMTLLRFRGLPLGWRIVDGGTAD